MIIRIFQLEQYEVRLIKDIEFCGDYQEEKILWQIRAEHVIINVLTYSGISA